MPRKPLRLKSKLAAFVKRAVRSANHKAAIKATLQKYPKGPYRKARAKFFYNKLRYGFGSGYKVPRMVYGLDYHRNSLS